MMIKKIFALNKAILLFLSSSSILLRHSVITKQILFDKVVNIKKDKIAFFRRPNLWHQNVTCRGVGVIKITGFRSDDWIYWQFGYITTINTFSTVAGLHNLHSPLHKH
jgi:hypothetical protein